MSSPANILGVAPEKTRVDRKSREWQDAQWAKWPTAAHWPGSLDLYEAAAYLRCAYITLWRACQTGRDHKARLAHRRLGDGYRIAKADLDRFGRVEARA